jgi:hypothetical protein
MLHFEYILMPCDRGDSGWLLRRGLAGKGCKLLIIRVMCGAGLQWPASASGLAG